MKRQLFLFLGLALVALLQSKASAQFTFIGPSGGDFFNSLNWQDGGGFNPASIVDGGTGKIELNLIIDGDNVAAGAEVDFGLGSLSMLAGSLFNVNSGRIDFDSGSSLSMTNATMNVLNNASSQFDMNDGSSLSIVDSFLTATDDIFFRGTTSLSGSTIVSVADDIEFQNTSVINLIHNNVFTTTDIVQIVAFQSSANITNSTFNTGRLSLETGTNLVATDSIFNLNGDIDDAFNNRTDGTLTLKGNTTLRADQLDEGIAIYLDDSSSASLIDDNAEGEWITTASIGDLLPSKVVIRSLNASLTLAGQTSVTDDATQIFNGLTATEYSYATHSQFFNPNNWNGQDDVTITAAVVPEPSSLLLSLALLGSCLLGASGRHW